MKNPGVKQAAREYDKHKARQRQITAARAEHVYGGELTPAELRAEHERLKRECLARHPEWGLSS